MVITNHILTNNFDFPDLQTINVGQQIAVLFGPVAGKLWMKRRRYLCDKPKECTSKLYIITIY